MGNARVEVDIVFEKSFRAPRQLGLYTPMGAEQDEGELLALL